MPSLSLLAFAAICFSGLAAAWETEQDAAIQVRHLLSSPSEHFGSGVLSTLYPSSHADTSLHNSPLSGPEYFAPCQSNGDLTFLALPVSQNWKNALSPGANVTFSVGSNPNPAIVDWRHTEKGDPTKWESKRPDWRKGMPSKLRVVLFGHVQQLPDEATDSKTTQLAECFKSLHKDSKRWAPGADESPHEAKWVQLVIDRVYAVGGFGDEHRIGWISKEAYRQAGDLKKSEQADGSGQLSLAETSADGHLHLEQLFGDNEGKTASSSQPSERSAIPELAAPFFGTPSTRTLA